jgi:hypothetical protein
MTIVDLNLSIWNVDLNVDLNVDWIARTPESAIVNRNRQCKSAIGNVNRQSQSSIDNLNRQSPIDQIRNPQSPIRNELICHS